MKLNLKAEYDIFVKMSFEEKRNTVISILEWIKEKNKLFSDIYKLIKSTQAIEQDFFDIYNSLIIVLHKEDRVAERIAINQLYEIKNNLNDQQQKEETEKLQSKKDVELLLNGIL